MLEKESSDFRLQALSRWVFDDLGFAGSELAPASADASFRRYFRLSSGNDTYIVMDAPPEKENLAPFVQVAGSLADMGLNVPLLLARNLPQGLLLLSDLGSTSYLTVLNASNADSLYADAFAALITLQTAGAGSGNFLPAYDAALLEREMDIMPEWFLGKYLGLKLSVAERSLLKTLFERLTQVALEQPCGFVHRDYHSRNLMVCAQQNPGILDFQDAVWGPITYDLVSLLKDCYIEWPEPTVHHWALNFRRRLLAHGLAAGASDAEFISWFDLMGLQRHLKVLGIFARLFYRDGKSQYLKDLPLVFRYVQNVINKYPQTIEFSKFFNSILAPAFARARAERKADTEVLGKARNAH